MFTRFTMLIMLTLLSFSSSSLATELSVMGGSRIGGDFEFEGGGEVSLKDSESIAVALGFDVSNYQKVELFWSHQDSYVKTPIDGARFGLGVDYFHVGGSVDYGKDKVIPYIAGGLGATYFSPEKSSFDSKYRFSISIGGGVKLMPVKNFGVRLEARGYGTWFPEETAFYCNSATGRCLFYSEADVLWQMDLMGGVFVNF